MLKIQEERFNNQTECLAQKSKPALSAVRKALTVPAIIIIAFVVISLASSQIPKLLF